MFGEREQQKKKKKHLKTTRILKQKKKNYLIEECKNEMKMCTFSSGV